MGPAVIKLAQDWSSTLWNACPAEGPAGTIQEFRLRNLEGWVKFLAAYAKANGALTGFLTYFPDGFANKVKPGEFAYYVSPAHRRRGVGTALLLSARQRFPMLDFRPSAQNYSAEGLLCYRAAQRVARTLAQKSFGLSPVAR